MTELKRFLAGLYDALSEAEMQALLHSQRRLKRALEEGRIPEDASLPVYHATDVRARLRVGLEAEEMQEGTEIFVTGWSEDETPALSFDIEVFDLLSREDLARIEVGDVPETVDEDEVEHRVDLTGPAFGEREREEAEEEPGEAEEEPGEAEEDTGDEPEEEREE